MRIVVGQPVYEERWARWAELLSPYGFLVEPNGTRRAFAPSAAALEALGSEEGYAAFGAVDGASVAVGEYGCWRSSQDGGDTWTHVCRAVLPAPSLSGGATFESDFGATTTGKVLNALLWVPPFTLVKAIQYGFALADPDREVGDADFDELYKVRAASDAAARAAIPSALRSACLESRFVGTVWLEPGCLSWCARDENDLRADDPLYQLGWAPIFVRALRAG